MRPSEVSSALRQIAARIDNSKKPQRALVVKDLQSVLAAMNRQAEEDDQQQQEEQDQD